MARLPYSLKVLLENALRLEDGTSVTADDVEAIATWDAKADPSVEIPFQPARVLMQDFTGVPAVVDLAAMRDAMEDLGGSPSAINPAGRRRPGHRPLGPGRRLRQPEGLRDQRGARLRAKRRALRLPALGPDGLRQLPGRAAGDRDLPPGQPRVPRSVRLYARAGRDDPGISGHPGRHRLPHDDDQRPRRARLGRGRDRGGGGDARAADLDAAPAGDRLQADRRAPRGRHRHRPGPDRHRDAPREGRRLQVRRVLRPGHRRTRPGRPGDDRQHVAGVRLDLRDLPDRRRDPPLPRVHRPPNRADRAGRRLHARAGPLPRARLRGADLQRHPRARPRRRRAEHRGPEAPAGPDRAHQRQAGVPRGDAGVGPRGRRGARQHARRRDRRVVPGLGPAGRGPRRRGRQAEARRPDSRRGGAQDERLRCRSSSRTARPSSSTTAWS